MTRPTLPTLPTLTTVRGTLAELPTTNLRHVATLALVLATAARFLTVGLPSGAAGDGWHAWLLFLASMSGLDVTAFGLKRFSDREYAAAKHPTPATPAPATPSIPPTVTETASAPTANDVLRFAPRRTIESERGD